MLLQAAWVLFGFLLSPLSLKPAHAKYVEFNIIKVTAFLFVVSITPDIYTIIYKISLYSFSWVCAWSGSWHGAVTEDKMGHP